VTSEQRKRVVELAREWIGTPYHSSARRQGRERGCGVDCVQLIIAVYHDAGLIPDVNPGHYSPEIHLHQPDSTYLTQVLRYSREIEESQVLPGDLLLFHVGKAYGHGAIIEEWPAKIIHALVSCGVIESHGRNEGFLPRMAPRFFTID